MDTMEANGAHLFELAKRLSMNRPTTRFPETDLAVCLAAEIRNTKKDIQADLFQGKIYRKTLSH